MNIKLTTQVQPKIELQYPVLARAKQQAYEHTVLFVEEKTGIVVDGGKSDYYSERLGNYRKFASVTDSSVWEILPVGTAVTFTQGQ